MKTFTKIFGIIFILGFVLGFSPAGTVNAADGDPVCVDGEPVVCFTTIQAAITAAPDGGTVRIADGTYVEILNINKNLTLVGESQAGVIIDTSGSS